MRGQTEHDKEIKALFVSSIRFQLGKYIKFDDTEQKWYSENYSDDPIVDKEEDEEEKKPKKIAIKKYSGNGKRPFHDDPESLRIETKLSKVKSKLVCPRCKKEKEDEDCLYDVYFEVKGIERSSHEGWVLDDFEYRVCGSCQNEIERYIRI